MHFSQVLEILRKLEKTTCRTSQGFQEKFVTLTPYVKRQPRGWCK